MAERCVWDIVRQNSPLRKLILSDLSLPQTAGLSHADKLIELGGVCNFYKVLVTVEKPTLHLVNGHYGYTSPSQELETMPE